jgi:hypothetical protein
MNAEKLELVRGSGNVFRDLGRENAHQEQLQALLALKSSKRPVEASQRCGRRSPEPASQRPASLASATQTFARLRLTACYQSSII